MSTTPAFLRALVDDAALFPPGEAPMPQAVGAHLEHRHSPYAELVGPFVVGDVRLPELLEALDALPDTRRHGRPGPLPVTVVVTGGAGALEPAVRWATGNDLLLDLRGVEIALRDEADLAHNARRVVTALDQLLASGVLEEDTPLHVEPPRLHGAPPSHSWLSALDEVAAMDLSLKFRTGGLSADAFPGAEELATCLEAALDRELRFKCTAGLHHAARHRAADTGFEHHGFLNVLLATRASLDGASTADVAAVLELADPAALAARVRETAPDELSSARRWFTSFGSCSVREPLEDLVSLGLLAEDLLPPSPTDPPIPLEDA